MTTNTLARRARLAIGQQDIKEAIDTIQQYFDLSPLNQFFGVEGNISLKDLFGQREDFKGSDLRVCVDDVETDILVSDKNRLGDRYDFGIEIARLYQWKKRNVWGDYFIVFSGGRDVICIPMTPIQAYMLDGVMTADHTEETVSNFYLLRTNVRNPVFIKSSVIKEMAKKYMTEIQRRFLEIVPTIGGAFEGSKSTFSKEFNCPSGIDLKCLKDVDCKDVSFDGVRKSCQIAKVMLYIDIENNLNPRDYVILVEKLLENVA